MTSPDDKSTNSSHQYDQSATQDERREVLTNDSAVARRPINRDGWIGGGRTESAEDVQTIRQRMVEAQHRRAVANRQGPQGEQWLSGAPDASTFYAEAHKGLDEETGEANQPSAKVYGSDLAAPNWAPDPVGLEPPLGYSINDLEPDQLANTPAILSEQADAADENQIASAPFISKPLRRRI